MRVILDTNVLVRVAVSPAGPAAKLFRLLTSAQEHVLVLSLPILDEVEDVLSRPYFRSRIAPIEREAFRSLLAATAELSIPGEGPPIIEHDPADDVILYTARAGRADVICTRNLRHFQSGGAPKFCAEHGIRVFGDLGLLSELRSL